MKAKLSFIAFSLLASAQFSLPAQAQNFTTLITTPLAIEGLTGDNRANLYVAGRRVQATVTDQGVPCPVWRINLASPSLVTVGFIPAPTATTVCSPSGIAFDSHGFLYVSDGDKVYKLLPNQNTQSTATIFASGVTGTNGLGFDRKGNLWTGDGTTGLGRVWKITPAGAVTEVFRIQPMQNPVPVGRSVLTIPTNNPQPLVANGVAFGRDGSLFVADTARGAIWRVKFDSQGNIASKMGCDTTFTPAAVAAKTLCLDNIYVQHSLLDGVDGIALDSSGGIWADANERNAVIVVTAAREVVEIFRNPPNGSNLRNDGPLETPTSPFLTGRKLCTSNSDGNRRDNSPNTAGEINPAGPNRGKISCMDQLLNVTGLPLPIR